MQVLQRAQPSFPDGVDWFAKCAALIRRECELDLASRAAATSIQSDSPATVAGLLLQSRLAIAEPGISPQLSEKLRLVLELAGYLRQRLDLPMQPIDPPHQIRRQLLAQAAGVHTA